MCGTALLTYLDCIKNWVNAPDEHVESLISEFNAFVNLGDYDPDPVIDVEVAGMVHLAKILRDETAKADAIQIGTNATAVAMLWSFGFGMMALTGFKAWELLMSQNISSKSEELNEKLKTLDIILASKMSGDVKTYIEKYKFNNVIINDHAAKGMDKTQCRANIHQFMAGVYRKTGSIDVSTFAKYAHMADKIYNFPNIGTLFGTLDNVLMSDKKEEDKANDMFNHMHRFLEYTKITREDIFLVMGCVLPKMLSSGISRECIKLSAETLQIPVEEVDDVAIGILETVEEFARAVAIAFSVVDAMKMIFRVTDVVEQCKKECAELEGPIKQHYKDFFNTIRETSDKFRKVADLK